MSKYVIQFSKTGIICFTSHLDLMRIFKRAFKRAGYALKHSDVFETAVIPIGDGVSVSCKK